MKLQVVSQIQCQALDDARLQRLVSIHNNCNAEIDFKDLKVGVQYFVERSPQKYKCVRFDGKNVDGSLKIFKVPPQNTLVVGGGVSSICRVSLLFNIVLIMFLTASLTCFSALGTSHFIALS